VGQFVAVLGGLALANITLPYLAKMDWYKSVVTTLWNNEQLVSWIFYILLSAVFYLVINLLWRLVVLHLIDAAKGSPVLSRLLGLVLGVLDWAILLVVACILFAALPGWLGQNAPDWIKTADSYLTSSKITGYLVPLFKDLLNLLGITHVGA
jgi:Colicin V production protein.